MSMWRKLAGIGLCAVLLLVAGIGLLRSISSDTATGVTYGASGGIAPPPLARAVPGPTIETQTLHARKSDPIVSERESTEDKYSKLVKDPQGARNVLNIFGMDLGSQQAKVQAIRSAIIDTGSCADSICMKTKESLLARIDAAAAQARRPLTKSIQCYQVGCVADISAPAGIPLQLVTDSVQQSEKFGWPVPTMLSSPTIEKDNTQSAMWVLFNPATISAL